MSDHKQTRSRHTLRLKGYDYAGAGIYFVTICCRQRACLLGEVIRGEMHLSPLGEAVRACWQAIPLHFPHVELDAFVVMPNHLHGIVILTERGGDMDRANIDSPLPRSPSLTLGSIVRGFKIGVSKWLRGNGDTTPIWQRNYYEQILRDEGGLHRVRQYIADNPLRWHEDQENPRSRRGE